MDKIGQSTYRLVSYNQGIKRFTQEIPEKEVTKTNIFSGKNVSKLGIQAPEGTKFLINNQLIIIGASGLYELDEEGLIITSLIIEDPLAENIIIDYLYEERPVFK